MAKRTGNRSRGIQVRRKGDLEYLIICICADKKQQQRSLRKKVFFDPLWTYFLSTI